MVWHLHLMMLEPHAAGIRGKLQSPTESLGPSKRLPTKGFRLEELMKTLVFALCFLGCASAAFGQAAGVLSYEPQVIQPTTHPQHAGPQAMSVEQNLLISSGYVSAKGERPVWEFASFRTIEPFGDTARLLRKEHASAKKAKKIWEN